MSTFLTLVNEGRWGVITRGVSEAFVKERLGEPGDISVKSNPTIWKYGPIEFTFLRGHSDDQPTLKLIHFAFDSVAPMPSGLQVEGWWPTPETSPESLRSRLEQNGVRILYDVKDTHTTQYLVLSPRGLVTYLNGLLKSADWFLEKGTPMKQVTVNLTVADYEVVRLLSTRSSLSVSKLCSKWISEHVGRLREGSAP